MMQQLRWVVLLAVLPSLLALLAAGQARPEPMGVDPDMLDGGGFNSDGLTLDEAYILGKSIYLGRNKKLRSLRVCLNMSKGADEAPTVVRPSRDVLKKFVGRPITVLTTRLIDCGDPTSQIALTLAPNDFRALVYYMNKKFRLRLKS